MKTHLRLDFVVRALPLVLPKGPDWVRTRATMRTNSGIIQAVTALEQELRERIACLRGYPHQRTRTKRYRLALPQLGERPTCIDCLMLWDAAQEAGLA